MAASGAGEELLAVALLTLRGPVEVLLTRALRRTARLRPEVFARLGSYQGAAFLICPNEAPIGFRLAPDGPSGRVTVVRRDAAGPFAAVIRGPLLSLIDLFDGALDADAAFFARRIEVEGDVAAVLALHNALEAAELSLVDLLGLPAGRRTAEAVLARLRSVAARAGVAGA